VFVQGKGSQDVTTSGGKRSSRSTIDSHDEGMEVTKDLQKDCAGVIVTLNQPTADYTVILNRESKHNRGLLRTNSQIQVANRLGDILGANATRTVGNASKNACQLILTDWSQHGRLPVPDTPALAPVAAAVAPAADPVPAERAKVEAVSSVRSSPKGAAAGTTANITKTDDGSGTAGDAETKLSGPERTSEATAEISSEPSGADIEIDGSFVGSTPSSVAIAGGEHALRVSKKGYKQWERTLRSSKGNIRIAAVLERIPVTSTGTARVAQTRDAGPSLGNENEPSPLVPVAAPSKGNDPATPASSAIRVPEPAAGSPGGPLEETLIGVSFAGNPTVRHDGVEISGVQPKGPADSIDIRSGDIILAINAHYLFTIDEVRAELLRYKPGARLLIRYRRNQFISENYLTLRTEGFSGK
jgi:hypothetical protein